MLQGERLSLCLKRCSQQIVETKREKNILQNPEMIYGYKWMFFIGGVVDVFLYENGPPLAPVTLENDETRPDNFMVAGAAYLVSMMGTKVSDDE